jgi:hypothetical protein
MGFLASKNGAAFIVSSLIGFVVARYLFDDVWAIFAYILISYHLFLLWLVITAEHEAGFSLPIFTTLITHLACVGVVVGITIERHYIPYFGLIRYFIPAMAPFERDWLFKAGPAKPPSILKEEKKKKTPDPAADKAAIARAIESATGEDHEAWTKYLAKRDSRLRKPGMTVKEEYEQWMVARVNSRSGSS